MVGAARRATERRAQRAPHHDGRQRVWCAGHVRRRRSDAGDGSHCQGRAALYELPLHVAVFAVARGVDNRAKPPRRRLRRGGRDRDRVPGLQLDHPEGERHHRRHPEGQRVRDLVVRQESQHAVLSSDFGRALRAVAERHGLRVFLRLRRRRHQPVAAEPVPQHDAHLPLPGQSGLEPDDRHGRRGDPLHEGVEGDRTRQALPRLLRAGRHALPAPSDAGVDQEDRRHASLRRRLEQGARDHLRQPEAAGHHACQRPTDPLAEGSAGVGFAGRGREDALHQAGRRVRRLPRLHRPRNRPRHPGGRGHGPARQHADHLHRRRQRRELRRDDQRHA